MNQQWKVASSAVALAIGLAWAAPAAAHCDTLDGPVVTAARAALDEGDPRLVLGWVGERDEPGVRDAFERTLVLRKAAPQERAYADNAFFETVVRLHRAGEGAPYTGLKPAGEIEPPIAAADAALANRTPAEVARLLSDRLEGGLHARFEAVNAHHERDPRDVAAGREFVRAYVDYVHYVERLYNDAGTVAEHGAPANHAH